MKYSNIIIKLKLMQKHIEIYNDKNKKTTNQLIKFLIKIK